MAYCSKCGHQVHDEAEICVHCGCRIKSPTIFNAAGEQNIIRFALTFFLGWIGSLIINNTFLKPMGWRSRTLAYLFLGIITAGIYPFVASICNIFFDPAKPANIGYFQD